MPAILNLTYKEKFLTKAEGDHLYINGGDKLIDFTSGWNVMNAGWNNPEIIDHLKNHLANHSSYSPSWINNDQLTAFHSLINSRLKEDYALVKCTSGSESVEAAIKLARRVTQKSNFMGFRQVYHGWTMGASLVGGLDRNKDYITDISGFEYLEFPDIHSSDETEYSERLLKKLADKNPAALLLEPIFTNPGGFSLTPSFIKEIVEVCKKQNTLIICDEVGTGFGRTGYFFGFEYYDDFIPDMICLSKAITNGTIPMGCTLIKSKLIEGKGISKSGLFNTYGCTPLACAAALGTLHYILNHDLADRAKRLGKLGMKILTEGLSHLENITIQGRGLFIALIFRKQEDPQKYISYDTIRELKEKLFEKGIFIESSDYCNALLIMPPLTISEKNFSTGLTRIIHEIKIHNFE